MTFEDLLQELRIDYKTEGNHHCRAGWLQIDCPFCGLDSKRFHLGYNINRKYVNCWRCGPHNLTEAISLLTGKNKYDARKLLGDLEHQFVATKETTGTLVLPKGLQPLQPAHIKYLEGRGYVVEALVSLWQIKCTTLHSKLPWRIFIPIIHEGVVVSWTSRCLVDEGLRYLAAPADCEAMNHKHLLYGSDYCRHACIVHEGPLDVWKTGPGAVGTCGTGYSRQQVRRISRFPLRVICFDNEPQAQKRAQSLCDELEPFQGRTLNVQLDSKDAGSATRRELRQLRALIH